MLSLPAMNTTLFTVRVGDHEVHARASSDHKHLRGDHVWLTFSRYHVFDKASGVRRESYPEAS
jgi:hypothetical protein